MSEPDILANRQNYTLVLTSLDAVDGPVKTIKAPENGWTTSALEEHAHLLPEGDAFLVPPGEDTASSDAVWVGSSEV